MSILLLRGINFLTTINTIFKPFERLSKSYDRGIGNRDGNIPTPSPSKEGSNS